MKTVTTGTKTSLRNDNEVSEMGVGSSYLLGLTSNEGFEKIFRCQDVPIPIKNGLRHGLPCDTLWKSKLDFEESR